MIAFRCTQRDIGTSYQWGTIMTLKTNLFQGWFIGATIFTCFTTGNYISEQYFEGSQIPWLFTAVAALIINWWGCAIIKDFSATPSEEATPSGNPSELKTQL